eukprot:76679-Rhodomonas_salina.1
MRRKHRRSSSRSSRSSRSRGFDADGGHRVCLGQECTRKGRKGTHPVPNGARNVRGPDSTRPERYYAHARKARSELRELLHSARKVLWRYRARRYRVGTGSAVVRSGMGGAGKGGGAGGHGGRWER